METTRGWWGFPLAPRPSASQRRRAALQSPPSSVASMLIPSCAIPSDPAGRSASSSGAQTGPVDPRLRPLLRITSCALTSTCPPRSAGTACEVSSETRSARPAVRRSREVAHARSQRMSTTWALVGPADASSGTSDTVAGSWRASRRPEWPFLAARHTFKVGLPGREAAARSLLQAREA